MPGQQFEPGSPRFALVEVRLYTEMVMVVSQHNATEKLEMCPAELNAINTDGTELYGPLSETCRDIGLINLIIVVFSFVGKVFLGSKHPKSHQILKLYSPVTIFWQI